MAILVSAIKAAFANNTRVKQLEPVFTGCGEFFGAASFE
jgi:hypothetical protein